MKVAIVAPLFASASASAFAPQSNNVRQTVSTQAENSHREALSTISTAGAFILPAAANAATGESPQFSTYETPVAVRGLAKTPEQKKLAKQFFQAIEEASLQATLKNGDKCMALLESTKLLNQFSKIL